MPYISPERSLQLIALMVFIAALLLLEGLYLLWKANRGSQAKKLSKRLEALTARAVRAKQMQLLKGGAPDQLSPIERWISRIPKTQQLNRRVAQGDVKWTAAQLLTVSGMLAVLGFVATVSFLRQPALLGMSAGIVGAALPWIYVAFVRRRRLERIHRQMPDALDFMTRALRAGHSFSSALLMVAEEMPDPIGGEFNTVHDEISFGVSLELALANLSERVPLTDLRYFAVSVLIQRESGGNLAEVLEDLSRLIRERYKLFSKIKVLSTDGRFSAWILLLAPFALGGLMTVLNPDFMEPLWNDPMGATMIRTLLVLMAIGVFLMNRIVKIRV